MNPPRIHLLLALLREIREHARGRAFAVAGLMLLVAALEGSGLLILAPLLSLVGVAAQPQASGDGPLNALSDSLGLSLSLSGVLLGYLALIVLHALASWRRDVASMQLQQDFVDRLRLQLYQHIGSAEWSFLARTHSAELGHALNTDLGRISMGLSALLQLLTTGAMALAYLAIAFGLSAPLTGLTLALGTVLLLVLRRHHGASHEGGYRLTGVTQRLHGEVSEFLAGLKLIKSSNLEQTTLRRYRQRLQEARQEGLAFTHRQAISRGLLRVGGAIALALLTYVALAHMQIAPASVLVLVFIFSRLFPFLSTLQQSYERLLYNLPAYASFDTMRRRCAAAAEPAGAATPPPFARELRLEQLHYRPPGAAADILQGVTLGIPWRSTVALIGPSGAGKSTLADLLGGLLAPSAGRILVDGVELADRRAWRECVAYVSMPASARTCSGASRAPPSPSCATRWRRPRPTSSTSCRRAWTRCWASAAYACRAASASGWRSHAHCCAGRSC